MPIQTLVSFEVKRLSILNPAGEVDSALVPALADSQLLQLYELMQFTRLADQRALHLQREGRLGTYPSTLGQEAAQVGSALALSAADWVFPSFRELGVYLTRAYPLSLIYRYWAGDERGLQSPPELNFFPLCIAVGTHVLHAAGAALAAKYRKDAVVAVAYLGDGGTSKGDFHEALNLAGVYQLPLVVVCQNNQWAISVPRQKQTAAASLAQKAIAHGIPGVQVDGNDVLAVYRATAEALERARSGGGPTFIECETYRLADHTTADDARRYRDPVEVARWQELDPLLRLQRLLQARGLWQEAAQQQGQQALQQRIDQAVAEAQGAPPVEVAEMFRFTGHGLSSRQQEQLEEARHGGS